MRNPVHSPAASRGLIRLTTHDVVITGMLGALAIVLGSIPGLGFIPAPTPAGSATTMHIPAILAGILEGPVVGAFVGFIFGFFSFTRATLPFFKNPLIAFGPRILIGVLAFYAFVLLRGRYARLLSGVVLGAAFYTMLGPGAARFNQAFAEGKIKAGWLVNLFHSVTSFTAAQPWLPVVVGLLTAYVAYRVLGGENAAPAVGAIVGTLTNTVGVLGLIKVFFGWPWEAVLLVGVTHGLPEVFLAVVVTVPIYRAVHQLRRGKE